MPNIIDTNAANCQDCYRCVRVCPVKAIRVNGGQARIDARLCVQCGTCVRECPQHAKEVLDSTQRVRAWLEAGEIVVASVAPSFPAAYPGWQSTRLPAALRLLGFSAVSETAEAARVVAEASAKQAGITTCCPAVIHYIEKYRPDHTALIMPLASPMIAHGRMLKARYGVRAKTVFIGPCAAKKGEALRTALAGSVDAVLTFAELAAWMEAEQVDLSRCPASGFDGQGDPGAARLFPLEGGLLQTAGIQPPVGDAGALRVSGPEAVMQLFDTPVAEWPYGIVEPMFCAGGCGVGPCMLSPIDAFTAARAVVANAEKAQNLPADVPEIDLMATYAPDPVAPYLAPVDEAQITRILEDTGKSDEAAQLNCGACGYPTCRDNAIAVARGIAEPGMCIAYVRQKVRMRADHIIDNSPNGIIVVDTDLHILEMNARFRQMFDVGSEMIGRHVARITDPEGFEKLLSGAEGTQEAIRTRGGGRYQELIFMLPGDLEITGIYVDIAERTFDDRQVALIKDESLRHAQGLLAHQIRFSQEMAHFLGKSTAQTEELVKRLMELYAEDVDT